MEQKELYLPESLQELVGKTKTLAKRSDDMAYDEVPYVRALERFYAGVSPAGRKSIKQFDLQRKRLGKERRDISEAEIMNEGARREAQEFYTEWIRSALCKLVDMAIQKIFRTG